jgi:hypothetical protein
MEKLESSGLIKFRGSYYRSDQVSDGKLIYSSFPIGFWAMPSDPDLWQDRYKQYLKTDCWAEKKRVCTERFHRSCALCTKDSAVVHHRTYNFSHFGLEEDSMLTALCSGCHHLYHNPYPGLEDVRNEVLDGIKNKDGMVCPTCDQFCKMYKRKLNAGMAATLCWLVREFKGDWINIPQCAPRFVIKSNEHGKLAHWKLVEQKSNLDDPTKKDSGIWKPTELGISFVNQESNVPKHVFLYNNSVQGFSDSTTSIKEALGDKFDYSELMKEDSHD